MQGVPSPQGLPTRGPSLTPQGCNPHLYPGSPCVTPGLALSPDPWLLGLSTGNKHPLLWGSVGPSNPIEPATLPHLARPPLHSKRQQWSHIRYLSCPRSPTPVRAEAWALGDSVLSRTSAGRPGRGPPRQCRTHVGRGQEQADPSLLPPPGCQRSRVLRVLQAASAGECAWRPL